MATKKKNNDIRICILQRGWVMVGRYSKKGTQCTLSGARVVRRWGTTNGIGELASCGPLPNTKLDAPGPGPVEFHELTVIATVACDVAKWGQYVG